MGANGRSWRDCFQNCEELGELAPRWVEPSRWVRRRRDLAGGWGWFQIPAVVCDDRGLDSLRMQTELSLAHGIQATLVPTVSFQNAAFEVYGKSLPSAEMGGDLIDVIESNGNLLVYVADVSGHGLEAGQLMGMLKTALRVSLQFRQPPAD